MNELPPIVEKYIIFRAYFDLIGSCAVLLLLAGLLIFFAVITRRR